MGKLRGFCYRYFEKGCRKKCTRQCPSRKVLWVALSWISYPEKFERTAREAIDVCLQLLKESNKIRFDSCSVRNSVLVDHIPYYLSGLSRALFFWQPFSKSAVFKPHCRDCLIGHLHDGVISVYLRKEFNCDRTFLRHQNGRRFIVLKHQHGGHKVMWNGFNLALIGQLHADVT